MNIQYLNNLFVQLFISLLNSDYINLLFLLILTYFTLSVFINSKKYKKKIIFFILFYWFNSNIHLSFFNFILLINNQTSININLLNGFLGIHPIILYISYAFIIILILKKKTINLKINMLLFTLLMLVIILGAWWAEQELSWNNWWSWDLIELISYVLIVIILLILHFYKKPINYITRNYFLTLLTFKFILFLLVVRLNLISSLHTFIPPFNIDQFLNYLFLYSTLICFFLFLKFKCNLMNYFLNLRNFNFRKINLIKVTFLIIVNFTFIIFFIQLILNFFFNFSIIDFLKINLFLITYFSLIFVKLPYLNFWIYLVFCLLVLNFFTKYIYIIFYKSNSIHIYFVLFLIILFCYSNLEYLIDNNNIWLFFLKNINIKLNYLNINFAFAQNYFFHSSLNFSSSYFNYYFKSFFFKNNNEHLLTNILNNIFFVYNNIQIYFYKYYFYINVINYSLIFLILLFLLFLLFLFKKFFLKKNFKFF